MKITSSKCSIAMQLCIVPGFIITSTRFRHSRRWVSVRRWGVSRCSFYSPSLVSRRLHSWHAEEWICCQRPHGRWRHHINLRLGDAGTESVAELVVHVMMLNDAILLSMSWLCGCDILIIYLIFTKAEYRKPLTPHPISLPRPGRFEKTPAIDRSGV